MKTVALYHADADYSAALIEQLRARLPHHHVVPWRAGQPADYLLAWKPRKGLFQTEGLRAVFALGAGIDAFLVDDLPETIPLVRLEEAGMGAQMLEMALYGILYYSRDMMALQRAQKTGEWLGQSTPKKLPFSVSVGVMGMGQLGYYVATRLAALGYPVSGLSRTRKQSDAVTCYDMSEQTTFLSRAEVLINLLPLTPATENCLNYDMFSRLPKGSYVINLARGRHLVEEDLSKALDEGLISGALLDVFRTEPLPQAHPFWHDERIIVTPHLAAITLQSDAVAQIGNNILALEAGRPMTGVVNRQLGY